MSSSQPFNFLSLPPELRNRIYYYAFARYPNNKNRFCSCFLHLAGPQCDHCTTQLLRVNQQLRSETLPIYLHTHLFVLWLSPQYKTSLTSWIDSLSDAEIGFLRRLRFDRKWREQCGCWHPSMALVEINLDASEEEKRLVAVTTPDQRFRVKKFEEMLEVVRGLPVDGRGRARLTREGLERLIAVVGWNCGRCTSLECDGNCETKVWVA